MDRLAPGSLLAQVRPANTTAATAFTAATGLRTAITTVVICNTSGAACTARVFHDDDGSTYDQTTALLYDVPLAAGETILFESGVAADGFTLMPTGTIGVRTSVASAITFSVYGVTQQVR